MEDEPVAQIRETSRNLLNLNRRFQRNEETDNNRSLANLSITPQTIQDIADRLKTKAPTTAAELHCLKNGLMDEPKGIEIVLNTHGALRGLVRELTGNDVKKQLAAAGCFCNLGLANSKAGAAVAKAAGSYLITAVDSLTTELAVSCIWAVGNLAGSGSKASELLTAQGALAKLCELLLSTNNEVTDAAVYALVHFSYQMKDQISNEQLVKIISALSKLNTSKALCQLLFILSCHQDFNMVMPVTSIHKILTGLPMSIKTHLASCQSNCSTECILLYQVRILANVILNDRIYSIFLVSFSEIVEEFKMLLLKDDHVTASVIWLLGNLYNFNCDSMFFNELLR